MNKQQLALFRHEHLTYLISKLGIEFPVADLHRTTHYAESTISGYLGGKVPISKKFLRSFCEVYNFDYENEFVNISSSTKDAILKTTILKPALKIVKKMDDDLKNWTGSKFEENINKEIPKEDKEFYSIMKTRITDLENILNNK